MTQVSFTAWAQTPLGAAVDRQDSLADLGQPTFQPGVVLQPPGGVPVETVLGPSFNLVGPGSVVGIDRGLVVRTEPAAGSFGSEPNYLAAVEFSLPELPWILTPARAAGERLRPWMVLVVVEATVPFADVSPLPVLSAPLAVLPDLADSWAWAHVQTAESGAEVARLLCPRMLRPNTDYRACVVPSFTSGVQAGLGDPGALTAANTPAWPAGADPIRLPVYFQWSFTTGDEGDFRDLVKRLHGAEPSALAGAARMIDVGRPFREEKPLLQIEEPQTQAMQGVLRPFGAEPHGTVTDAAFQDWSPRMTELLEAPRRRLDKPTPLPPPPQPGELPQPAPPEPGAVAPPLYAGRHLQRDVVHGDGNPWVEELNLGPANRVAAALGAEYVRANQEELMARAWEQVGAIREVNRMRAIAELATDVAASLHRQHVSTMTPGELVSFAAPAQTRTRTAADTTLAMEVSFSPLLDSIASTAFARLMRPQGRLARSVPTSVESIVTGGLAGQVSTREPPRVIDAAMTSFGGQMDAASDLGQASSTVVQAAQVGGAANQLATLRALSTVAAANGLGDAAAPLDQAIASLGLPQAALDAMQAGDVETVGDRIAGLPMRDLMTSVAGVAASLAPSEGAAPGPITERGVAIGASALRDRLVHGLEPGDRLARRLRSLVAAPEPLNPANLDQVMAYPSFPVPTAMAVLDTDPDWFLPGIADFPMNRVEVLRVNGPFVESYLVGINHEMMRELLWREYPTDQRGTPFAQFWPRPDAQPDIPPIHTWRDTEFSGAIPLGQHLTLGGDEIAVLLVRGDVLRRFPDVVVSAVRAAVVGGHRVPAPGVAATEPLFVLRIDGATNAYAFQLPVAELDPANDGDGWFFIFQEHSYRMRFGFRPPGSEAGFDSWDHLAWPSADGPGQVPLDRDFARAGTELTGPPGAEPQWNRDSADIARIALQRPFRLAYHSRKLLGAADG